MEWFSKENRFPRDLYVHVYASLGVGTEEIYYIQAGRMLYPRMCNEMHMSQTCTNTQNKIQI